MGEKKISEPLTEKLHLTASNTQTLLLKTFQVLSVKFFMWLFPTGFQLIHTLAVTVSY